MNAKLEQASQLRDGVRIFRWRVFTSNGRYVMWGPTKDAVKQRALRLGLSPVTVVPVEGLLDET